FTGETGIQVDVPASGASAPGSTVINFAALPSWVAVNQLVMDQTRANALPNSIITAVNVSAHTITVATPVGSAGIIGGDEKQFSGTGVFPDSLTLITDMAGGSDFRSLDAAHSKLWPGDVVELDGTTQFPAVLYGGIANISVVNVDAAGHPDYVWFEGDGTNRPHLSGLSVGQASYVIARGIDVDHTSPLNQYSGSSPLSNGVTFSRVATGTDTFTVNGEVWTYTTGSTDITIHLIAAGTTATNTAANTAAALTAAAAAGDTAAQGWATYSANGAGLTLRKTGWTGTGLPSFSTSIIQTNTEAGISTANPLPGAVAASAVHISGSVTAPAYAVYLQDIYVDAGGTTGTRKQLDDFPMTGSMG
ncbi:MAG: hypothetical protein ACREP9_12995, partial [Candidatus Dormibacteraceae bacterium]